jgi:plastocyanin
MTFINIQNFSVSHNPLVISEGVIIRWTNLDSVGHNVTSGDPGDFDAGALFDSPVLGRGQTFDFLPPEAGTYRYFCRPHEATMFGYELIVE